MPATSIPADAVVGIVGAGTMGSGIAQVAALCGHPVRIYDAAPGQSVRATEAIASQLAHRVEKGRLAPTARDAALARLATVPALEDLADAVMVIEAVAERMDVKRQVFATLEGVCSADTIFATNTSSLSVDAMAAGLEHPGRLVGMHFFNPAPVMALVEVVAGLATTAPVAEVVLETARAWGKVAVRATSTPGFIVNRVARPFYGEALNLLNESAADAGTIDAVMRDAADFRMGPLELIDLIGQDVNYAVTCSIFEAFHYDPRYRPSLVQKALVDANRLGRKSGRGFYDYREGARRAEPGEAAPAARPKRIRLFGRLGWAEPLIPAIENAGIAVEQDEQQGVRPFHAELPSGARLLPTDGTTATEHAARLSRPVVVFDLMRDPAAASRVALAPSDGCPDAVVGEAVGAFQAVGKRVSLVDDVPGLIVMRVIAMLANEACDAVHQRVATADAVDTAMVKGTNYPEGPLAWADRLGPRNVLHVLDNLAAAYGDGRYRASPLLRRRAAAGAPLKRCGSGTR